VLVADQLPGRNLVDARPETLAATPFEQGRAATVNDVDRVSGAVLELTALELELVPRDGGTGDMMPHRAVVEHADPTLFPGAVLGRPCDIVQPDPLSVPSPEMDVVEIERRVLVATTDDDSPRASVRPLEVPEILVVPVEREVPNHDLSVAAAPVVDQRVVVLVVGHMLGYCQSRLRGPVAVHRYSGRLASVRPGEQDQSTHAGSVVADMVRSGRHVDRAVLASGVGGRVDRVEVPLRGGGARIVRVRFRAVVCDALGADPLGHRGDRLPVHVGGAVVPGVVPVGPGVRRQQVGTAGQGGGHAAGQAQDPSTGDRSLVHP